MDKKNYVKGCSMQRTPLLEAEGFCFWKTRFETYVKSKDIDLWQVIQNDFVFMMDDPETKMEVKTPYEFLKDDEKKQLGKNNEANITFYNALPRKEYEESSCVKPPRRAKVVVIKEAKDMATLPLDESLALKAKVIMEQTSDDSYSQRGSDEYVDKEEDKPFNFIAKNFFLGTKEVKAQDKSEVATISAKKVTSLVNVKSQRRTRILLEELGAIVKTTMNRKMMQHDNEEFLKFSKDFFKTYEKLLQEKHAPKKEHSKLFRKVNELEFKVKKLVKSKEVIKPCQKCEVQTQEVNSLKSNVSKLQDEALNFSKFKKSSVVLDNMLTSAAGTKVTTVGVEKDMDLESAHMVAASNVPMLKPENGNSAPKTTVMEGVEKVIPPTTIEEKAQKRLEVKAKSTLMMGIPNEHQLNLTKSRMRKTLDQTFDRLQKLVSQLEILGEKLSQEDVNQKLTNEAVNTAYEVFAISTQVSAANVDNLSDAVICAFFSSQLNNPQHANEDLQQLYPDDLEEIDLRWQMVMLTMRARRFLKNIVRNLTMNGIDIHLQD
ncbi:hypothetical protein Tco_0228745 [Tanacetum coccineum]